MFPPGIFSKSIVKWCGYTKRASFSMRLCWFQEPHHSVTKLFTKCNWHSTVLLIFAFSSFINFLDYGNAHIAKSENLTKKVCKAMTGWAARDWGCANFQWNWLYGTDRHSDYRDSCRECLWCTTHVFVRRVWWRQVAKVSKWPPQESLTVHHIGQHHLFSHHHLNHHHYPERL